MNIIIKDDIEDRFRRTVAITKGFKKGNISIALEEAIELCRANTNDQRMGGRENKSQYPIT